jgi:hypothetical protein
VEHTVGGAAHVRDEPVVPSLRPGGICRGCRVFDRNILAKQRRTDAMGEAGPGARWRPDTLFSPCVDDVLCGASLSLPLSLSLSLSLLLCTVVGKSGGTAAREGGGMQRQPHKPQRAQVKTQPTRLPPSPCPLCVPACVWCAPRVSAPRAVAAP